MAKTNTAETTVGEWKAFIEDDAWWGDCIYDDASFILEGEVYVGDVPDDPSNKRFSDNTPMTVTSGHVVREDDDYLVKDAQSLTAFFEKWKKWRECSENRGFKQVIAEFPEGVSQGDVAKLLLSIGGRLKR